MRIFGLLLCGLSSIVFIVAAVVFFSFYNSFQKTDYLFAEYKSAGVYGDISNAVTSQIASMREDGSDLEEENPQDPMQSQIQERFISVLFSESSVENIIEKNLIRLKEFIHSDQETFTAYSPFSDSSTTDSILSQMGIGEMAEDPEFKKMFQASSQGMMAQNNPFQAISPLAESLRTSLNILKYTLPVFAAISLVVFIFLGKGIGRVRNIGILSILISFNLGISFLLSRALYFMSNQNGGWGEENIGSQIANGILSPIVLLSADWIGKCAILSLVIGIVCIVVWFVMRMNGVPQPAKSVKKVRTPKKRT